MFLNINLAVRKLCHPKVANHKKKTGLTYLKSELSKHLKKGRDGKFAKVCRDQKRENKTAKKLLQSSPTARDAKYLNKSHNNGNADKNNQQSSFNNS